MRNEDGDRDVDADTDGQHRHDGGCACGCGCGCGCGDGGGGGGGGGGGSGDGGGGGGGGGAAAAACGAAPVDDAINNDILDDRFCRKWLSPSVLTLISNNFIVVNVTVTTASLAVITTITTTREREAALVAEDTKTEVWIVHETNLYYEASFHWPNAETGTAQTQAWFRAIRCGKSVRS